MDEPVIRSLVWATDIDVLERDHVLARRDGYWVVRSPGNPTYWWGNFLLFDEVPGVGDRERWESVFAAEFATSPRVAHRTFAWDRTDGDAGAAADFVSDGYTSERLTGLIAAPRQLRPHPRANGEVTVHELSPAPGQDEDLWDQVIDVQMAEPFEHSPPEYHRAFLRRRQAGLRELFDDGRGAWFVALDQEQVVASLGVVVTGGRARYQAVDTLPSHRRRGIASRLVYEAAQLTLAAHSIDRFVIVADPEYHAIGIYESLGFEPIETVCGVMKTPQRS